ncbi:MAG: purine-nucleoside phosphorylase [bacterium]|nr:purine-nucleoside phosphorylase [bacterium]
MSGSDVSHPVGVVAGSGLDLSGLLDRVTRDDAFADMAGLTASTVQGHAGRFIHGFSGETPLVAQCGRLHAYEGLPLDEVTRTVDAMAEFGVRTIVFTNAAGGLREDMAPGDTMAAERLRVMGFRGWPGAPETLQPDLVVPGCAHQGTYAWVHGPCYETRAEIGMLQRLDADAVGMSTAPEIDRCRALGIRTAAISCITNNCCNRQVLTHTHVIETAKTASERITGLIRQALPTLRAV